MEQKQLSRKHAVCKKVSKENNKLSKLNEDLILHMAIQRKQVMGLLRKEEIIKDEHEQATDEIERLKAENEQLNPRLKHNKWLRLIGAET